MAFAEDNYEDAIVELFCNQLGYNYVHGSNVQRDFHSPVLQDELESSLRRVNPDVGEDLIQEAKRRILNVEGKTVLQKNERFTHYLQNGIIVSCSVNDELITEPVYLVDFENKERNEFTIAQQWAFIDISNRRPDLTFFINGMPFAVAELKSPSREETGVSDAYLQLQNDARELPSLFVYVQVCVISDLAISKVGTFTSSEDRFVEWKSKDGSYEKTQFAKYDTFFEGIFEKARILDILKNFILFLGPNKILAGYHQYFGARKALASIQAAADGRGGVLWHTQGSGKSLTMAFLAQLAQNAISEATILVVTDRNDLDNQLFGTFKLCSKFLRQTPVQAESHKILKEMLSNSQANGIIFSTIQKFEQADEPLSVRSNIIVIVDEAHRGQYGFEEKVDINTGKVSYGFARNMRDSLPQATFVGFTATPISSKDRSTREVFGDYIDIYDMTQSVEDGVTCPVRFEGRMLRLELDADALRLIDQEYDNLAINCEEYAIGKSKEELSRLESILGSDQAIDALCKDIVEDYENNRMNLPGDKAMIVAFSRAAAIDIYLKILELRPEWRDMIAVVTSDKNTDPESWHDILGNKSQREEKIKLFKDASSGLKIIIVCDMLLTGFDAPSLSTMYLYKPLRDHGLMQAISRVNRVFAGKTGGVVVDYIGIASALGHAMNEYTVRDQSNYSTMDNSKTVYLQFMEKLGVCRDVFSGFDYSKFLDPSTTNLTRANLIMGGMNFLVDPSDKDDKMNVLINEAMFLKKTLPLCLSMLDIQERHEVAFFLAVRTIATRISRRDKALSFSEINKVINEILKLCIRCEGVVVLFSNASFSITDPNLVKVLASLGPHLAIVLIHRICVEQVQDYTDISRTVKFSEMIIKNMAEYMDGTVTTAKTLNVMFETMNDLTEIAKTDELKLSVKGLSVFEELCRNEAIREYFSNNDLADMVRDVVNNIDKKKNVDWMSRPSGIAAMKRLVRDVVLKYSFPKEIQKNVLTIIFKRLEVWNIKDDDSAMLAMEKNSSFYLNGRILTIRNK